MARRCPRRIHAARPPEAEWDIWWAATAVVPEVTTFLVPLRAAVGARPRVNGDVLYFCPHINTF